MSGKVLVVGNQVGEADFLADRLRTKGYTVDVAYDIQGGFDMFGSTQHDLVITDLPSTDGYPLLRRVKERAREVRAERSLHAIDISSTSIEEVDAALKAGAASAYRKPYDIGVLMQRVDQLLDRSEDG